MKNRTSKMERIDIELDASVAERIEQIAASHGKSLSEYVRESVIQPLLGLPTAA